MRYMSKRSPNGKPLTPDDRRHGTNAGYVQHHIQKVFPVCEPCKEASRAYQLAWKRTHQASVDTTNANYRRRTPEERAARSTARSQERRQRLRAGRPDAVEDTIASLSPEQRKEFGLD